MSQNFSQSGSHMSREDMLRELELLPVWQLRQPLPTLFNAELKTTDKGEQFIEETVVQEPATQEQQLPVADIPAIAITAAEAPATESVSPESSIPEPASSVPPVFEAFAPQQIEVVESVEEAVVDTPVLEQIQPLVLRLLLSEGSHYAFLMEPYAAEDNVQQVETLLKNMMRAMQASCRVDVINRADKIFAVHTPKLMISLGAAPANQLSGKTHTLEEWRHIQQESPSLYEQIPLIVTYHPAHLLTNTADKALAWRDLCAAMKLVQSL